VKNKSGFSPDLNQLFTSLGIAGSTQKFFHHYRGKNDQGYDFLFKITHHQDKEQ